LRERGGAWSRELASGRAVRVAVNHELVAADAPVREGDEIALLPPVTGG
jgi:molybdopterin synthase sulfur carrier subunit